MSLKLVASPKPIIKGSSKPTAEEIGCCVVCKLCIFSDQEWGRARRPLIGKAHKSCGGDAQ